MSDHFPIAESIEVITERVDAALGRIEDLDLPNYIVTDDGLLRSIAWLESKITRQEPWPMLALILCLREGEARGLIERVEGDGGS